MVQLVLVTRPIEQARAFAAEIEALGCRALIQPILTICPVPVEGGVLPIPDAILLTSAQAVQSFHFPSAWQGCPVFCVGDKTAEAARLAGAVNCLAGTQGLDGLLPLIHDRLPRGSHILYLCGEHVAHDAQQALPEYTVTSVPTYRAEALEALPEAIRTAFPQITVIALFSARTAQILENLVVENGLEPGARNIKLLCLSSSVLESLTAVQWASCHVADLPTQTAMIEKLKNLIQG